MDDLKDRLKEILRRDYGIETDEQLLQAVSEIDLDLGIFVDTEPAEKRGAA